MKAATAPQLHSDNHLARQEPPRRWEALDLLRGLSILGMLLNLNPGAWDKQYTWLQHAKWQGGHLIDMVAPAFLFCIGAALPLSLERRMRDASGRGPIYMHILWRSLALVALGLLINAYPGFDWAHLRLPGVLQRIGVTYGLVGAFLVLIAKRGSERAVGFSPRIILAAGGFVLVSYWALLYFVPVPGFGAPRFDPVGSWPAFVDRAVFGTRHMFVYWKVDGKIVFDPDGLLLVYPTAFDILLGALASIAYRKKLLAKPILAGLAAGCGMMLLAVALNPICPIVKNIYTSTFALFSGGFALVLLTLLTAAVDSDSGNRFAWKKLFFFAKIFGANATLAYVLNFALAPLLDLAWIPYHGQRLSIRWGSQLALSSALPAEHASFLFGCLWLTALGSILWIFYRKRWFLKL
jgi:predicted acyltransferase